MVQVCVVARAKQDPGVLFKKKPKINCQFIPIIEFLFFLFSLVFGLYFLLSMNTKVKAYLPIQKNNNK